MTSSTSRRSSSISFGQSLDLRGYARAPPDTLPRVLYPGRGGLGFGRAVGAGGDEETGGNPG